MVLRVVVAPDKFKGSLTASEAAAAMRAGVRDAAPDAEIATIPVSDGGEGMLALVEGLGGLRVEVEVTGPLGAPVTAAYVAHDGVAYLECAEACGLALVPHPSPGTASAATSYGVGELVLHALDAGHRRICLGLGGSACTDGGAGMAQALGAGVLDATGRPVRRGGASLAAARVVDLHGLDRRLAETEVHAACDVDNPLTGPTGAAAVYGPQKGADTEAIAVLDAALSTFVDALGSALGHDLAHRPGAGAAGGLGLGATAFLGAVMTSGAEMMLGLVGADHTIGASDLVVVGEGRLDEQTLHGKAPAAVAALARRHGVPCVAVAGVVTAAPDALTAAGLAAAHSLLEIAGSPERAMADAAALLRTVTARAVAAAV